MPLKTLLCCLLISCCSLADAQSDSSFAKPMRVGIVGLVHEHVHWILGREKRGDIEIVGIAEPNRALAEAYAKQHGYSMDIVYASMEEMIKKTKPAAVFAYNPIIDHLPVVAYCAPLGIHIMVEKPMAVNAAQAIKMEVLAKKHHVQLLTNYETTWYGSNAKAYALINQTQTTGDIRKIVFHTGHQGPKEIGCNPEFLAWLTDPVKNGGGALTDFGCYGANLATWLMKGATPETVTAITQQMKPDIYPNVEDEATIVLTYKKAQVIIQASWNWPYSRKDMEVYGVNGFVFCKDGTNMVLKEKDANSESTRANPLAKDRDDPFVYFTNVIRGNVKPQPFDLSALDNNLIVVKILDAARASAKTGKTIKWEERYRK